MDRLKQMKNMLMSCVENQMTHLEEIDTKELGEAIDMIKDLEEAIYYCTVVEAMEQPKEYGFSRREESYRPSYEEPRSYYSNGNGNHSTMSGNSSVSHYSEPTTHSSYDYRDYREGRSPQSRRMYMESKELHQDKATQMRELEKYMQELTQDIIEMIEGASPEEKQYLNKRVSALANKLAQLND